MYVAIPKLVLMVNVAMELDVYMQEELNIQDVIVVVGELNVIVLILIVGGIMILQMHVVVRPHQIRVVFVPVELLVISHVMELVLVKKKTVGGLVMVMPILMTVVFAPGDIPTM
tara:strand:- start:59 stop:400 length:342 start_codon:yes stop_codon:yes gene_type:complete